MKVRDAIRLLEAEGWRHVRTKGSHRSYKHPSKPNLVVVAGQPGKDLCEGTWKAILRTAGLKEDR